jgi:hypothetical protein
VNKKCVRNKSFALKRISDYFCLNILGRKAQFEQKQSILAGKETLCTTEGTVELSLNRVHALNVGIR